MKKIIISVTLGVLFSTVLSQTNNILNLNSGYPLPVSKYSFQNNWKGLFTFEYKYEKRIFNNTYLGGASELSFFEATHVPTNLTIINTKVSIMYMLPYIRTSVNAGYSFMKFKTKMIDSAFINNDGGVFIQPEIYTGITIKGFLNIGIYSSYCYIFEQFGNDSVVLYNGKKDKNVAYVSLGTKLNYIF